MDTNAVKVHFRVIRFIQEAGLKLRLTSLPIATAAVIYHKFFRENKITDFDPYLVGTTALYMAGKIEEEVVKLRDVVNICHRTLHKNKPPLDIGETFWSLRESVASSELLILRSLRFKVVFSQPHKFVLHYLKFLKDWFDPHDWDTIPISKTSWAFLRDCYHGDMCLNYKAEHIAIGVIYFALLSHGMEVPYHNEADMKWWQENPNQPPKMVLSDDLTLPTVQNIISDLMTLYEMEILVQS
ncbi:hypothetical protein LOTGIDRAFT_237668 [Lottia gigantea]|uniref:Cyclin-Q n=1 Tax=Lottia gigantea TaxID=225164 RepID=V4CMJ3_LOTGI|nr:hypothetical protein LOTGIDRAFT_237668 [Lottia gigantea]ESP03570.1 hypothetical protein LOTGIDRAFT_237668 [Lottia gigantea]